MTGQKGFEGVTVRTDNLLIKLFSNIPLPESLTEIQMGPIGNQGMKGMFRKMRLLLESYINLLHQCSLQKRMRS